MLKSSLEKEKKEAKAIEIQKHDCPWRCTLSPCTLHDHPANVSSSKHALSNGLTGLKVAGAMQQKWKEKKRKKTI